MIAALRNATEAFKDRSGWGRLMKRAMRNNFSWASAAEKYIKLYSKLENKRQRN
jgi:glycogen synthase